MSRYRFCLLPAVGSNCRGDIVFIIDSSASVGKLNWYVTKQFLIDIIRRFKINDRQTRFGVVSYATKAVANFQLRKYDDVDEMAKKIWDLTYLGGVSNTADAISVIG